MTESALHHTLTLAYYPIAVVTFALLVFVVAPYGRHQKAGWGPTVGARTGWILMELPAVLGWAIIYFMGRHRFELAPLVMLAIWQVHYVNRTLIFPFRISAGAKRMPLAIISMGGLFQLYNSYLNARWISEFGVYPSRWLATPQFGLGLVLFAFGFFLNLHSDAILRNLRKPGETGYKVPYGGGYQWVSCPNYLAEIIEWTGWAILTWSLAGAAFAIYTIANLLPRALQHHRWYKSQFAEYPADRKAIIPYLL